MNSSQRVHVATTEFEHALDSGPDGLERAAEALSVLRPELCPRRRSEYERLERSYDEAERAQEEAQDAH